MTNITGTVAAVKAVTDAEADTGNAINLATDFTITLDAGTAAVTDLSSLNSKTTGNINAQNITALTGTAAAINTFITTEESDAGNGVNLDTDFTATVSDTNTVATHLSTLNGNMAGLITATNVTNLTGTISEVKAVTDAEADTGNAINLNTTFTATVSDNGSAAASDLSSISD